MARAYGVTPSVLNRLLVDKLGADVGGIVDKEVFTPEGKLRKYKERLLRPSEVAWAHHLAQQSRLRARKRPGKVKIIKPAKNPAEEGD